MPGTTFPRNPLQQKESDQAAEGLLTGVVELPKTLLLDLPGAAMDLSDYAQGKLFPPAPGAPPVGQDEPVRHALGVASKFYDDTVKSVLGTSEETANSAPYNISSTISSFAAFPGGAEKAIMEAPSLVGRGWRAITHVVNPATIAGKVATGTALGVGTEALLHPSDAEAATPTQQAAPPVAPVAGQLPKGFREVTAAPAQAAPDPQIPNSLLKLGARPVTIHPAVDEHAQKQSDDSIWPWVTLGTAGGLLIALLSKGKNAKSALELSRGGASIFGKAATDASPEVSNLTKWTQGMVDGGASARDTMMKMDPKLGQDFADRQTLASPTALTEKHEMALRDGVIAGTNTKLNPLVDQGNKLAGLAQRDPTIPGKFDKYAYALDALDGSKRGLMVRKYDGWEKDVPTAVNLPDPKIRRAIKNHLQQFVDGIEQPRFPNGTPNPNYNPDIMKIQMALKQNYASVASHFLKSGLIDKPTYFDWSTRDFMHLKAQLDQGEWRARLWKAITLPEKDLDIRDELGTLLERKNNDGERILPAIDAQEQYIRDVLRHTDKNELWRRFVTSVKAQPVGSSLRKLVSDVTNTQGVKNLLSYRDGGRIKHVQIHDQHVYSALKFNPSGNLLYPIINGSRNLAQMTITGPLAPGFAIKGLGFDIFGIAALGDKVGPLGIVKMPYFALKGLGQGLGARMARGMSQSLKASAYADGTLPKLLGPQVTDTLIKRGSQIWRQSLLYQAQSVGAMGASRAMSDAAIGNRLTLMPKLAPRYATTNPAVRSLKGLAHMYMGLWESVQNSARLGYFGSMVSKGAKYEDLVKAGAEVRRATGDFAQKGASRPAKAMSEIFPYYGVSVQSLARIAHQFRTKPAQTLTQVGFSLAIPSIAGAVYANMMGKKYRDYWNSLSSNDHASMIYLPWPGMPPERGIFIGVMPEWRPFHAMIANWMDAIFGFKSGVIDRNEAKGFENGLDSLFNHRMYADVSTGVQSGLLPFTPSSMPPLVNAGLNMFGVRNAGDIATGEPFKLAPLKDDDLSALDPGGTTRGVWMPQKVEQILSSLAGTAGLAFAHAAIAAEQAIYGGRSVLPAVGQSAALDMTRDVPLATTMWKLDRRIGANTATDQYAMGVFSDMKRLVAGARTDIGNVGTGTRGMSYNELANEGQFASDLPDDLSRFKDPNVGEIVARTGLYYRIWSKTWGNEMNSLAKTIEDVRSSTKLSPIQMRTKLNKLYVKMQDLHKGALSDIQANLMVPLNQEYGRAIDLGKIGLDTQITDFPPLAAP